jgi:hypothetical protein
MRARMLAVAVAIAAAVVALSLVASVLFVKGEGGLRLGGMLVAGCQ